MSRLDNWLEEIKAGNGGWVRIYLDAFSVPISDPERFFRALDIFGEHAMLEAIIAASTKKFTEDPLGYIIAIANSKAVEESVRNLKIDMYRADMARAQEATKAFNTMLAEKIKKAKEL